MKFQPEGHFLDLIRELQRHRGIYESFVVAPLPHHGNQIMLYRELEQRPQVKASLKEYYRTSAVPLLLQSHFLDYEALWQEYRKNPAFENVMKMRSKEFSDPAFEVWWNFRQTSGDFGF